MKIEYWKSKSHVELYFKIFWWYLEEKAIHIKALTTNQFFYFFDLFIDRLLYIVVWSSSSQIERSRKSVRSLYIYGTTTPASIQTLWRCLQYFSGFFRKIGHVNKWLFDRIWWHRFSRHNICNMLFMTGNEDKKSYSYALIMTHRRNVTNMNLRV